MFVWYRGSSKKIHLRYGKTIRQFSCSLGDYSPFDGSLNLVHPEHPPNRKRSSQYIKFLEIINSYSNKPVQGCLTTRSVELELLECKDGLKALTV